MWRVLDSAIDWFVLREGRFERLPLTGAGHYRSETFPGLWLDPAAIFGATSPWSRRCFNGTRRARACGVHREARGRPPGLVMGPYSGSSGKADTSIYPRLGWKLDTAERSGISCDRFGYCYVRLPLPHLRQV